MPTPDCRSPPDSRFTTWLQVRHLAADIPKSIFSPSCATLLKEVLISSTISFLSFARAAPWRKVNCRTSEPRFKMLNKLKSLHFENCYTCEKCNLPLHCSVVTREYWILSKIQTSVKLGGLRIFLYSWIWEKKTTNSICFSALQCKGWLSSTLIHNVWFWSPVILWSKLFSSDLWKHQVK